MVEGGSKVTLDLLYEIGTEEIPAGYLPPAAEQLRRAAEEFLAQPLQSERL